MHFGYTQIMGLDQVEEAFVRSKICWKVGEVFDPDLIESTRRSIEGSELFTTVIISFGTLNTEDGESSVPINIQLRERLHRTIGAGVNYRTDLGPGAILQWENRNMRNIGEKLSTQIDIREKRQKGQISYRQPDFLRQNQDLIWGSVVDHEHFNSYSVARWTGTAMIEREISAALNLFAGTGIKQQKITQSDSDRTDTLFTLPFGFHYSTANSTLDPTKGITAHLRITPSFELTDNKQTFIRQLASGTFYLPLRADEHLILAGKSTIGTLLGSSRIAIPPPDRFYAGGDSLLRGYPHLSVSPLDALSQPIGGRSLFVSSLELRLRTAGNWGGVTFFDVGNAYEEKFPQFNKKLFKSIGFGVRYETAIGPLRIDLAFPLDKRPVYDNSHELYISIGQAF